MIKTIDELFPLLDHLYIFQTLEYDSLAFLKWFLKNPWARNLQKKHHLVVTSKALALIFLATSLITLISLILSLGLFATILAFPFLLFLNLELSPFYLIISSLVLSPLEEYQKRRLFLAAQRRLAQLPNLKKIAIVGSFGKTSTKEMLYTLLWKKYRVVKTPKSFNTELSIARTVLSDLKDNTEVFIIEMDAYHPGEINDLCQLVKPSLGLITSIAPQHLERFGSMEKLASAQFELAKNLPNDGILFLNSSDEWTNKLALQVFDPEAQTRRGDALEAQTLFYGFRKEDNLSASNIRQTSTGLNFTLITPTSQISPSTSLRSSTPRSLRLEEIPDLTLPLFGNHHIINFLAAASLAHQLGMAWKEIQKRATLILPTPHRLEIKKQGETTIIDNTYNTNPVSAQSSLRLLHDLPGTQKILITPGLIELGARHSEENQIFAGKAAKIANHIIIVGEHAQKDLLIGLKKTDFPAEKIHLARDLPVALSQLSQITLPNSVVLLENDLPDQYS